MTLSQKAQAGGSQQTVYVLLAQAAIQRFDAYTAEVAAAIAPSLAGISVVPVSLLCLLLLGYVGARLGGARPGRSMLRTFFWGALAMAVTAVAGHLFGAAI